MGAKTNEENRKRGEQKHRKSFVGPFFSSCFEDVLKRKRTRLGRRWGERRRRKDSKVFQNIARKRNLATQAKKATRLTTAVTAISAIVIAITKLTTTITVTSNQVVYHIFIVPVKFVVLFSSFVAIAVVFSEIATSIIETITVCSICAKSAKPERNLTTTTTTTTDTAASEDDDNNNDYNYCDFNRPPSLPSFEANETLQGTRSSENNSLEFQSNGKTKAKTMVGRCDGS